MPKLPLTQAVRKKLKHSARFHFPGHGGQSPWPETAQILGQALYKADFTEIPGLDDLHQPQEVIKQAEEQAAQVFGARKSFFLVNGSSAGIQAMIWAATKPGQTVLLNRNAHRSALSGLILSGARPEWIYPPLVPDFACPGAILPEQLAAIGKRQQQGEINLTASVEVYPNYQGISGNLQAWNQLAVPLLVDEAHGCHFYFNTELAPGALLCGAEACVQSLHKTGGSLTQTALLHSQGNKISPAELARQLFLLQTTSPSYPLMLSLEGAVSFWQERGKQVLEQQIYRAEELRRRLSCLQGLQLLDQNYLGQAGITCLDPLRLVLQLKGWNGYCLAEALNRRCIPVEMAAPGFLVLVIGLSYTPQQGEILYQALKEIAKMPPEGRFYTLPLPTSPKAILTPREAFTGQKRLLKLEESVGEISSEWLAVYPPGIPALMPGEIITPEIRDYLLLVRKYKLHCQTSGDPELNWLGVAAEKTKWPFQAFKGHSKAPSFRDKEEY